MENNQNPLQRKKGPIQTMFDWTIAILFLITLIGLAWRHVLHPLFFGF